MAAPYIKFCKIYSLSWLDHNCYAYLQADWFLEHLTGSSVGSHLQPMHPDQAYSEFWLGSNSYLHWSTWLDPIPNQDPNVDPNSVGDTI